MVFTTVSRLKCEIGGSEMDDTVSKTSPREVNVVGLFLAVLLLASGCGSSL